MMETVLKDYGTVGIYYKKMEDKSKIHRRAIDHCKYTKRCVPRRLTVASRIHHLPYPTVCDAERSGSRVQSNQQWNLVDQPHTHRWLEPIREEQRWDDTVRIYTEDIRIRCGLRKCAALMMKRGKRVEDSEIFFAWRTNDERPRK